MSVGENNLIYVVGDLIGVLSNVDGRLYSLCRAVVVKHMLRLTDDVIPTSRRVLRTGGGSGFGGRPPAHMAA